jgi:hypothetical protein
MHLASENSCLYRRLRGLVLFDSRTGRVGSVQSLRVFFNVARRGYETDAADEA